MSAGTRRFIIRPGTTAVILTLLASAGGCALRSEVVLKQPFAPSSQQELKLTSRWTFCASDAGRRNCLLAFPLPAAQDGPRDFLLYVSAPAGEGQFHVDPESSAGARGFFIQAVGDLKGKTTFTGGTIEVSGVWLRPGWRRLDLALRCDDGTEINGRAFLQEMPAEVQAFERRYAGDIALLTPAPSQPAEGEATTEARPSSQP